MEDTDSKRNDPVWERDLIEEIATDALKEKRRARRWGIFFKLLTFVYIGGLIYLAMPDVFDQAQLKTTKEYTALVDLEGVIAPGEKASADNIVEGLRDAFEDKSTKAVVLRCNSPGGSPVQSSYVQKEILRLREKYPDIPLYAVVSDVCASGGYYVISSADEIYVNESSIVGSIGVLMNGFGFVEAIDELGVERRLMTSGEHKGIMDPFSPVKEKEQVHVKQMLGDIHQNFIAAVKQGRGDKLSEQNDLFSGLFWTGNKAIELGLADKIGSAGFVAREVVGVEDIKDYTSKEDPIERLAERLGTATAKSLLAEMGLNSAPELR